MSQSIHLVSINKTPARAVILVAQLLESLRNDYDIAHIANASSLEGVKIVLDALVHCPGILICSSQWSPEEQGQANVIAKSLFPNIIIINIPPGLDVREGSEGIISFLHHAVQSSGARKR